MSIRLTIEFQRFSKSILDLNKVVTKNRDKVMQIEMRLLTERLIQLTAPPHGRGGGTEAKRQGETAVSRDIQRVFKGIDAMSLRKFDKTFPGYSTTRGDFLFSPLFDPSLHEAQRNRRGGIGKRKDRTHVFGGLKFEDRIHVKNADLSRYIRSKMARVGRAKAGWNFAAQEFGAKSPAWVKRHGTVEGRAKKFFSHNYILLEATNLNKAMGEIDRRARVVREAIRSRTRDINTKISLIIKHAAEKFNRGKSR